MVAASRCFVVTSVAIEPATVRRNLLRYQESKRQRENPGEVPRGYAGRERKSRFLTWEAAPKRGRA